ncbi:hypothetical protein ASPWEDRAFT_103837 [Aspergillus wentii DTO 134E9]|uniref:Pre-mRNA splicing factor Clf1 n=1 Tax=Aspergillus wentii DTO 134E9 TaxID=1073089 RepID=A0A1L9RVI5_ASPWE|nr:uncharacterized protein ASPWEDRAFT_103837 [Aspergillus wentii DTO 134E9]KAI9928772.1 hypothetical protein MW887_001990 [Aspergillus wentii]OJJ38867.1 hypothetical protein ASPWEDRAFT_103837 [Aspergillus wentii DTO 134E9]
MIVPKPPVKLEGHCSVIYDNTLYTYSANGFASIPLEQDATWSNMTMGEPVSNAACITGAVDDTDKTAMYVIGGTGSSSDYTGLQRYSFQDKEWKTIEPPTDNLSNRTGHGVAYLKSTSSIFIYGGSQKDSSVASSENFILKTVAPYNLMSSSTDGVPPATSPVLLPWSDNQVALLRGATEPNSIHLFDYSNAADTSGTWEKSNATLAHPIADNIQCAMFMGSNGSKVLESFDLNVSPNTVTSSVLLDSNGEAAPAGQTAGSSKRDSLDDYPKYDSSLASTTTRSQYSLAQGDDGLVVLSSGSGTDSLSIFNQTSNGWVNATKLFYGDKSQQQILPSASPSASATPTGSSTAAPAAGNDNDSSNVGTIIGATLGSVVGAAAILLILLFILKKKKDNKKRAAAQAQGGSNDKGGRLSFQDQGIEPLTQSAYPMAKSPVPMAASSVDSLAIFSGKAGKESSGANPVVAQKSTQPKPSPLTTIQSSGEVTAASPYEADKSFETEDAIGGQPGDRRTNEGWSKYFQDNNTTDLVGMEPEPSNSREISKSEARQSAWPMTNLTPLNFGFLDEPKPLGQVFSGSPTTEHANPMDGRGLVIPEGQSARISSADSLSVASDKRYSQARDSEYRDSQWTTGPGHSSWLGRPTSSTYSESLYNPSVRDSHLPLGHEFRINDPARANARRSSALIPETLDERPRHSVNGDMSWLNLNSER